MVIGGYQFSGIYWARLRSALNRWLQASPAHRCAQLDFPSWRGRFHPHGASTRQQLVVAGCAPEPPFWNAEVVSPRFARGSVRPANGARNAWLAPIPGDECFS